MKYAVRLSDNTEYILIVEKNKGEKAAFKAESKKAKAKGREIVFFNPINEE
jgi:hypothetical protein